MVRIWFEGSTTDRLDPGLVIECSLESLLDQLGAGDEWITVALADDGGELYIRPDRLIAFKEDTG